MMLPLQVGKAQATQVPHNVQPLPALNILVADDIQQNLDLISILLGRSGHQITTASNGIEVLHLYHQQSFDLIILDVQMPILDGLSAASQIRVIEAEKALPHTPIIALTASVLQEDRKAAAEAGMDGFASKPININALTNEMLRVLHLHTRTPSNDALNAHNHSLPCAKNEMIDWEKGLALWGDESLYLQELMHFATGMPQHISGIQHALANKESKQLAALAHANKGVCGNLALPALYTHFTALEKQALAESLDSASETLVHIATTWEVLEAQLAPYSLPISTNVTDTKATNFNAEAIQQLLVELSHAAQQAEIDDHRMQALAELTPSLHLPATQLILSAFNEFEFNLAAEHIAHLQAKIRDGVYE
jgi:two-component system, sensor histidine kinase and response regulator